MLTQTKTETTIWVGMTREQQGSLIKALIAIHELDTNCGSPMELEDDDFVVLNDLRQALLNV